MFNNYIFKINNNLLLKVQTVPMKISKHIPTDMEFNKFNYVEAIKQVSRPKSNQSHSLCISSNNLNQSTPDSSQTDSDDLSPQIQRKRKTTIRNILPKFSVEENGMLFGIKIFFFLLSSN